MNPTAVAAIIIPKLNREQALACGQRFREGITNAHQAVLEFYQGAGWEALGYVSFEAAAQPVFGYSFQYLYKIRDAAQVERNLVGLSAPAGDGAQVSLSSIGTPQRELQSGASGGSSVARSSLTAATSTMLATANLAGQQSQPDIPQIPKIPVDHSQTLKQLPDPRDQRRAYELAQTTAAEANRRVTKHDVQDAITQLRQEGVEADRRAVFDSGFELLIFRMDNGYIAPGLARQVADALAACVPGVAADLQHLNITQPTVIRELNRLAQQRRESYQEITRSKALQFEDGSVVWIDKARPTQLERYLKEKRDEYRRQGFALHAGRIRWIGTCDAVSEGIGWVSFQLPDDPEIVRQLKTGRSYVIDLTWDVTKDADL